jgi:ABC-type branched-subunit amino acid transport system substrate-binding protein
VVQRRGKVLDEVYIPLQPAPRDFESVIGRIKKTSPDVIFSTVVGRGTSVFYEAYRNAGFDPAKMPIASLTTSEAEVAELHREAAEGHITAGRSLKPRHQFQVAASWKASSANTVQMRRYRQLRRLLIFRFIWRCALSRVADQTIRKWC